jgi:uncharacterized protein (DUF1697 family)
MPDPVLIDEESRWPTFVALLRGINVGRAKRVAMADLRALVEGLGTVMSARCSTAVTSSLGT